MNINEVPAAIKLTKKHWLKLFAVLVAEAILAFICFMVGPPIAYIGIAAVILGFIQSVAMVFIAVNMLIRLDTSGKTGIVAGIVFNIYLLVQSISWSIDTTYEQAYPFAIFWIACTIIFATSLTMNIRSLIARRRK